MCEPCQRCIEDGQICVNYVRDPYDDGQLCVNYVRDPQDDDKLCVNHVRDPQDDGQLCVNHVRHPQDDGQLCVNYVRDTQDDGQLWVNHLRDPYKMANSINHAQMERRWSTLLQLWHIWIEDAQLCFNYGTYRYEMVKPTSTMAQID